jgi:mannose-6-phosphate isomerase-like protein (cupin superfamily)
VVFFLVAQRWRKGQIRARAGHGSHHALAEKFRMFDDYWSPKIVGKINESYVKLAKFKGEFVWHSHANEDELFLVVKGSLRIKVREREIQLDAGEFTIVPRGVEHLPIADDEGHVLLLEPKSTLNTGNVRSDRTVDDLERI